MKYPDKEPLHKKHWQELVDQGLGYWDEDGEFCHLKPLALAIADVLGKIESPNPLIVEPKFLPEHQL